VTSNPDFKVMISFSVKITQKRYQSYIICNGGSVISLIWSIERRHFQWLWTTLTQFLRSR